MLTDVCKAAVIFGFELALAFVIGDFVAAFFKQTPQYWVSAGICTFFLIEGAVMVLIINKSHKKRRARIQTNEPNSSYPTNISVQSVAPAQLPQARDR